MPSCRQTLAAFVLAICACTQLAAASLAPAPPNQALDANNPAAAKCRDTLSKAVEKFSPLSHPGAPDRLTKKGDLSYDQATEYMKKLIFAFATIKQADFRRRCEPLLRDTTSLSTHYVNAYEKMEARMAWYEEAMDKHCAGHAEHSRKEGKDWLNRYAGMKSEAGKIEGAKSVVDDMTDVASIRGHVRVSRACKAFGGSQVGAKLKAMGARCREEMKQYEAALSTCEKVCKPRGKTAQCSVFSA